MAKSKVYIDVVVDDKGTTKRIAVNAKKLGESLDKTSKSARTADRNLKGAAQASANSTKNFSKMAQGIGGKLVPAYATLAANIFAVTAAFNAFQKASQIENLEKNLIRTGNIAGQNFAALSESLKEVTGNAIDTEQALRSVAQGTAQGFDASQLKDLTRIAKGASIALGRDMSDALDRLIRGTAKLEPEILDELGIIVRLDRAAKDYAQSLNKTENQLTAFEKQQAFANAVTEQGLKKFGDIAKLAEANPYDQLAATFGDLTKFLFELINVGLEPLVKFLGSNQFALAGAVAAFASTIVKQLTPALSEMAEEGRAKFSALNKAAVKAAAAVETKYSTAVKNLKEVKISPAGFKAVEDSIRKGTARTAEFTKALKSLEASERKRRADIKSLEAQTSSLRGVQRQAHLALIAEKEKELALVQGQIVATRELERIKKSGTGSVTQSGAANKAAAAGAAARIGRTEAAAARLMDGAGIGQQFAIAGKAAAKMTSQVGKATGVLGKIDTAFKVGAASARLFGTALLNAIPVVGQILFIGTLAYEGFMALFGSRFETTPVEEASEKLRESLEKIVIGARDVRTAMRDAGSTVEAEFIRMKGAAGSVDQVISGLKDILDVAITERDKAISKAATTAAGDDVKEGFFAKFAYTFTGDYQKALVELRAEALAAGKVTYFTFAQVQARVQKNAQDLLKTLQGKDVELSKSSLLADITASIASLNATGIVSPQVIAQLEAIKETVKNQEGDTVSATFAERIIGDVEKVNEPAKRFITTLDGINEAALQAGNTLAKFVEKADTPFTDLIQTAQAIEGSFITLRDTINSSGYSTQEELLELLNKQGDSTSDLVAKLQKSETFEKSLADARAEGLTETEALARALTQESTNYVEKLVSADQTYRNISANIDSLKAKQKEISEFTKRSAFFAQKNLDLDKEILTEKKSQFETTLSLLDKESENADERAYYLQVEKQIKALGLDILAIENDTLTVARAKNAEVQYLVSLQSKLLNEKQREAALEQQIFETRQKAALREAKRGFAFDFKDQGITEINQQIEAQQRQLLQLQSQTQTDIDNGKMAVIRAEYALLSAQVEAQAVALRSKAREADLSTAEGRTDNRALVAQAQQLENILPGLILAEETAVTNVGLATEAKIKGIVETIAALEQSKEDLSDIGQLTTAIEDSLTTSLTNGIDGVIRGTMSMKEAFRNMAQAVLGALSQVIAKLIAIKLLEMAIGFFSGGVSAGSAQGLSLSGGSTGAGAVSQNIGQNFNFGPPTPRYGGVFERTPGYATGGIARGREAGYPAILHGTEAVVPLPNNRSIPVELSGNSGATNNVVVNVTVDSNGNAQQNQSASSQQGAGLGKAIATAVQKELLNQKRSGGILNPYGAA